MRPRHVMPWYKKIIIHVFLASFFAGLLPMNQVASALSMINTLEPSSEMNPGGGLAEIRHVNSNETRYGLVAILVEDSLWDAKISNSGMFALLGSESLSGKIQTYAQDVQSTLPWTKTIIVKVSSLDTPVDIQRMLERFYFEGNPDDSNATKLSGVVIVGDVPLPVVNKMGNRFISLLPYTDFEEPSYILDAATQDFIPNQESQNLQTEVWNGVIVPPLDGQDGVDLLGAYFDKNHQFHDGNADYTTFNKKVFVGDLVTEERTVNPTAYASYDRYLGLWEELTYYRYTNDLALDLYTEMQTSVEAGDMLDNDGDYDATTGKGIDEEAANGIDDDGDGLVDEDLGDGFYGIDNDGDGAIDEDNFNDNNNDANWNHDDWFETSGAVANIYADRLVDEDPPGDTTGGEDLNGDGILDGDGCPGLCGVDDNGDSLDGDGDGYPNGWEVLFGYDPFDERDPWASVSDKVNNMYGKSFSTDEQATAYLENFFIDGFYTYNNEYRHPSCFATDGSYHPEWDDDEDGFCDEDGSTEIQIWADDNGTRTNGTCAYNDADCDGLVDEDPVGIRPEIMFTDLPDIQVQSVVKGMISRYTELFDQPQGVWNRIVGGTGRYKTQATDADGKSVTDYDTAISLIAKKDETVLQYLGNFNNHFEAHVNTLVENNLAIDIPIIANLKITGSYTPFTENEDGSITEGEPKEICDPDIKTDQPGSCLEFVNQSGFDEGLFDDEGNLKDLSELGPDDYYIAGQHLWDISSPMQCTTFAGTDEEGGQLAQFSTLYSRNFSTDEDHQDMSKGDVQEYRNCVPEFLPYLEDIPELCDEATVIQPIRVLDGAKAVADNVDTKGWETGAQACFEFRELTTFNLFTKTMVEFNNWLTGKLRKFAKEDSEDRDADYEAFLEKVDEKRNSYTPIPSEATLRKHFNELDMITGTDTGSHRYTMTDLLNELGYTNVGDDAIDTFIAFNNNETINYPQEGAHMDNVSELNLYLMKEYLKEGTQELTTNLDEAQMITSVYKNVEPTTATLNAQIENAGSPNLPIDKTRRISFIDSNGAAQEINYINIFDAVTVEDVQAQVAALQDDFSAVAGGSSYVDEIESDFNDTNMDQLEDALMWRTLSIDEKHLYVLTHYLGAEEAITSKARDGYEMVSLIADGDAKDLYFAFNGNKPTIESDLEWSSNEASSDPVPGDEPLANVSNTTPVLLFDWFDAIQEWLADVQDSLTTVDTFEEETYCGSKIEYDSTANTDGDGNGIPDDADATVSLTLTSDDNNVLQANGEDYYVVAVSAKRADGSINTDDNYTEVTLNISSGDDSVSISGNADLQLTGGIAIFSLLSKSEGSFTVFPRASNRSDLADGNSLSGTVVSKLVKISTYIIENQISGGAVTETLTDRMEIKDASGNIMAILDPETGDLELFGARAELREATGTLPTRVAIVSDAGETYGTFFIIPEEKSVSIGDGFAGVFVKEVAASATAVTDEEGVALENSSVQIGLVTARGQIALADGYRLDFDNPGAINIYDPIHVLDANGDTLFTVTIKHSFSQGKILSPETESNYSDYLGSVLPSGQDWPVGRRAPIIAENNGWLASAATVIRDTDTDMLDDLEEWTIGTALDNSDSDSDSYIDGLEIFSGYNPLVAGGKLFTDIAADNPAYKDLAVLYLRGIIKGYSDGSFRPNNKITREEFIKIDLGAICKNCDSYADEYKAALMANYGQAPFPDTNINPDLLACVAEGKVDEIISGYAGGNSAGYYLPTQNISRAEATKVLVETAGFEVTAPASGVSTPGEKWYSEYVKVAQENGLFPDGVNVTTEWLESSITRAEFVMMAVNLVEAKDCRAVDTDGDGLSDTEEQVLYGTDLLMADTDQGGVNDFEEIIRNSDPLNAADDFPSEGSSGTVGETATTDGSSGVEDFSGLSAYDHEPGLYAVSNNAGFEEISASTEIESDKVPVFTNDVPADGESTLFVRAEIRDQSDRIYTQDNTSVIRFVLSGTENGEILSKNVQVKNGTAETTFKTSNIAGDVTVEGHITDNSLPSQNADIHVYPGEPVRLELAGESTVLPAGAEAVSDMTVYLYDSFGNLAYNGFYTVTLSTLGGLTLLDLADEDAQTDGIQVTTSDGYLNFRVLASPDVDTSTVQASLLSVPDSGDTFDISHKKSMTLKVDQSMPFMLAAGATGETVTVSVVDGIGAYVTGFQGDVQMSLSDPGYGTFASNTITLVDGQASVYLSPGTLAGTGSIIAESAGLEGGSAPIDIKPAGIYELRIEKNDGNTILSAGEQARLIISGYDQYGNLVTTDSTTTGTIRMTDATKDFGTLMARSFTLNQGKASFGVIPANVSGTINIVVAATGILAGTWSGDVDYTISGEDFANIDPQMLYGSLLGGPFGDVTQENYIGGWMTFNGKTQAITSLVAEPKPKKRLATIDANGAITLPDDGMVTQNIMGAGTELPTRIAWRQFPDDTLLAEIFYVVNSNNALSEELLTANEDFVLEETDEGEILLREKSAAVVKIRKDGQIALLDPAYSLVINGAADGLGFGVLKNTQQILRIDFNSAWSGDVNQLETDFNLEDWDTLPSGIYVKPTTVTENRLVTIPTGNSSQSPMGMAVIDPNEDLAKEMQPSLGYASLESAEDDGSIGWENENKHLLLFSAGNTVGASNLFYASEVGIVLGDPTIKLQTQNEVNSLGFTADVGSLVSASQDDILALMDLDYNGDGLMDVLTAYEDGSIEVLQNSKAPVRLQNRGELLYVENGISSIDKGDFNGDGLEDLLIVTKEACYEGEVCMYEYDNIGGGFIAKNLNLTTIAGKPVQVEVADLNNDDYDDLVVVDENMVLYTVWNNSGTLETVDEIKDFGLQIDPSQNLNGDLVLHYDNLEKGSVTLPVVTTDLDSGSNATGSDLQAFVDSLGMDQDFALEVDGQSDTGTVSKNEDIAFEYANNSDIENLFTVTKNVTDGNGGRVEIGDELTYTITVENIAAQAFTDLYISDSVGTYFNFNRDSFSCGECGASNSATELQNGDSSRPFIYGPVSLVAGGTLSVSYTVSVAQLPSLSVMIGQDVYTDYKDDNYSDIVVSPLGNSTGTIELFYSDGYITESNGDGILGLGETGYRRMSYQEKQYSPTITETHSTASNNPFGDADGDGTPDFIEGMDAELGIPVSEGYDPIAEIMGGVDEDGNGYYSTDEMFQSTDDADGDGLHDIVDQWVSGSNLLLDPSIDLSGSGITSGSASGDDVALSSDESFELEASISVLDEEISGVTQVIEDTVALLTCQGGCLALPGSVAFGAIGTWHDPITGIPAGFDYGWPIFGILPYLPVVCTGPTCYGSNVMRIYLAPTTTLGLGLGLCFGPYGGGACWAFNIPLLQLLGVCDAINGFLSDSLSKATGFDSEGSTSAFNVDPSSTSSSDPSGMVSSVFQSYLPQVSVNKNIQVPGFPSIFTEWWKAQKEQFFKMLDLPDVTFIYPDPNSITTEFTGIRQKAIENQKEGAVDLDSEVKIEELKSSVLSLEKFLNMANALPLIDIKPETVQIRYPALTPEEREIVMRDWKDWVQDTKDSWAAFKAQFNLRDNVTAAEQEIFDELEGLVDTAIAAVEANMAILESYADIPEQILILRDIQAYYAKSIICYLDAVLSHTAGYLSENVQRIEAWAQFVVDLKTIVNGWQVLIDLSADFVKSCDKCTNQRYSALQLLFSLFAFMPEFPVVEMPKLPDIVIDVSSIQAGIDIIWPDIQFVPERINIPELPRLVFPTGKLTGDLNLDLVIPTLPVFKVDFEIPELPGLSLPDLPSLPPPPKVPELDPSISAALKIASSVLKIICIIKQGFIPIPETTLKAKIEDITQRPGTILPIDLIATVEWPKFNFDFVEKIQINTYLNLTTDFSVIYDVIKNFGDKSNEMTKDFVQEGLNKPLQSLADAIQDVINVLDFSVEADVSGEAGADLGTGEVNAEGEGEVKSESNNTESYNSAMDTATAYKDDPLVQENLVALQQVLVKLQSDFDAWGEQMPDTVTLKATQRFLSETDPLLNRYDEIIQGSPDLSKDFLASISDTPLASVATLRDSLISYVEDFDQGTNALQNMDGDSFQRYLAQENLHADYLLASDDGTSDDYSTGENWNPKDLVVQDDNTESVALASETVSADSSIQAFNTGLYLYDSEAGISTRLTDYAVEADEKSNILFMDLDGDGDEDIVYSMGGDVYIKENYTETPRLVYVSSDPDEITISDVNSNHGSVQNFKRGKNDYEEASFSFSQSYEAVGYEVLFYDSLDAEDAEPDENIKRVLLLSDTENEGISSEDPNLGKISSSRLHAENVGGKVKLLNAPQRTLISSTGELETDDGVSFQAIENTQIEVTVDGVMTTIELPAYSLITFGRLAGRVIRVDSGSVYWIQNTEIAESQDLLEGMEILPEEIVSLESAGATSLLVTTEGAEILLDKEEDFIMDRLNNPASPSSNIAIGNGAYYTVNRGLYEDGTWGTLSDNVLLNPQVCADTAEPYPLVDTASADSDGDGAVEVAIFSTLQLSAEGSFDSDSEIVDAYWDLDASVDADGDGILNNDQESIGLTGEIGPYDTTDPRVVTLYIIDAAGNTASTEINVEVYVPNIQIAEATVDSVSGTTDPASPIFPFHLVRDRSGVISEIGTGYSTDETGNFNEEMIGSELISVYDAEKNVIAQFNPKTKQVLVYNDLYTVEALSSASDWPSRLAVYEKSTGIVMGSFLFVSDSASPIQKMNQPLNTYDLSIYHEVNVYPVADEAGYEWTESSLLARDEYGNLDFMLNQSGNITIFDDRYTLVKRAATSLDEYLILDVYDEGQLELEIWPGTSGDASIVTTQDLGLSSSTLLNGMSADLSGNTRLNFEDISSEDAIYNDIAELVERGILEGYMENGKRYFKPTQSITRAEFTKIILSILCIVPRDEAYLLPSQFTDILDTGLWYFPFTKEAFLLNLITGYLGEKNTAGIAPFKPGNTITRAEAVKIVLEALNEEGVITLPENLSGEPWYLPYMNIAKDLTPYMATETTAGTSNFIVTAEEAADPSHKMSRYEFVEMSVRVLKAYNCFDLDSDGDGLSNYSEESVYGTDAYNPDTDGGGVDDGTEVGRFSDPLDGTDDFGLGVEEILPGVYAVTEVCSACPCTSSMNYDSDLMPGDNIFAIIENAAGEIFGVSNTVTIGN